MLHETYMRRCLDLASNAAGDAKPNPSVGAVIVHGDRIIGEGFHKAYGEPHAEVEAIRSVSERDQHLLREATLYVNLEPCSHHGKTPPCADLILETAIKHVVVGGGDPNPLVNGKGIQRLEEGGVKVTTGVLLDECTRLNKAFYTFHEKQRPYVILKWGQSIDGFIATKPLQRTNISNSLSQLFSHKWRTENAAILVGYNTALIDDPQLTPRHWQGKNPIRIVYDPQLKLPPSLKLFDGSTETWILNNREEKNINRLQYKLIDDGDWISQTLKLLYEANCMSVIVEGGANTLNAFIHQNIWDEARIFVSRNELNEGLSAPVLTGFRSQENHTLGDNLLNVYLR